MFMKELHCRQNIVQHLRFSSSEVVFSVLNQQHDDRKVVGTARRGSHCCRRVSSMYKPAVNISVFDKEARRLVDFCVTRFVDNGWRLRAGEKVPHMFNSGRVLMIPGSANSSTLRELGAGEHW